MKGTLLHNLLIVPFAMQGLHASVNVVDAQLVSIDREQQCIVLSDECTVQYGVLVLTMGLQCESLLSTQAGLSLPQVISLQELPGNMPEVTTGFLCMHSLLLTLITSSVAVHAVAVASMLSCCDSAQNHAARSCVAVTSVSTGQHCHTVLCLLPVSIPNSDQQCVSAFTTCNAQEVHHH